MIYFLRFRLSLCIFFDNRPRALKGAAVQEQMEIATRIETRRQ